GMCILGAIKEINELELVISLTNGLTGFVSITEISEEISKIAEQVANDDADEDELPELNSLFTVGQLVACAISELSDAGNKKKINLSIKPSIVNSSLVAKDVSSGMMLNAEVVSKEDHGYIMSVGIEGVKAFLNNKNIPEDVSLTVGQVISCGVVSIDGGFRTIQLTLKKEAIIPNSSSPSLTSLKPGSLVNVTVKKVMESGLQCLFCGIFNATIDFFNLSTEKPIEQLYKEKQKIHARIIYINYTKLKIGLSLNSNLINYEPVSFPDIRIGTIIDDVEVKRVDESIGTLVSFNNGVQGYVHVSRLDDKQVDNIAKKFRVGSKHKGRVVGLDYFGNIVHLSFQQSILNVKYFTYEDIEVGSVIKGTVYKLGSFGLLVSINDQIKALCPKRHFSDVQLKNPEKKFKVDSQVKFRVLEVIPKLKKVIITLRKSLVDSTLPIISSYDNIEKGMITMGVIEAVKPFGCIVKFYNQVHGLCPIHELSEDFIKNPEDHFHINQVVKCRVMDFDKEDSKLRVSFKLLNVEQQENYDKAKIGDIVNGKVIYRVDDGALIELNNMNGLRGFLPKAHMSDFEANSEIIHNQLKEGTLLNNLMVLYKDDSNNQIFLTMKKLLVDAHKAKELPETFEQIKVNTLIPGYVKFITKAYAIVSFLNDLVGVVIKDNVSDDYVKNVEDKLKLGKTVLALVTEVDKEKKHFNLSLKLLLKLNASAKKDVADTRRLIKDPIDSSITSLDDLIPGREIKARIKGVKKTQINMTLGSNLKGRIHITEVYDKYEDIKDTIKPLAGFKAGQVISCRVIGILNAKGYKYLPLTHKNPISQTTIELSVKPSRMALEPNTMGEPILGINDVKVDSFMVGAVANVTDNAVWMAVSPQLLGRVDLSELSNDINIVNNYKKHFLEGQIYPCYILNKNTKKGLLDISIRNAVEGKKEKKNMDNVKVGDILMGKVIKVQEGKGVNIKINNGLIGRAFITDINDVFEKNPTKDLKVGQVVSTYVLNVDKNNKQLDLSLRNSRITKEKCADKDAAADVQTLDDVEEGMVVYGYIKHVSDKGCFVALSSHLDARVKIAELSDLFVKEWKTLVSVGQLVKGKVIAIDKPNKRVELTLKESVVSPETAKKVIQWSDLSKGQKVTGTIKGIEEFGVFIRIDNSNISGLCHKMELSDSSVKDISKLYSVGDKVKAYILKVDLEKKRVSFSLKASYFADDEDSEDEDAMEEDVEEEIMEDVDNKEEDDDEEEEEDDDEEEEEDDEDDDEDDDGMDVDEKETTIDNKPKKDDDDDESKNESSKKSKRAKKREKLEREEKIREQEKMILDNDKLPEMADDFERLLLGSPNSSYIWIKYMAFQLHMAEVEKARQIAERALKTINYREEQEKMNVWIAYLNLENSYGTQESLLKVFERAVTLCEPKDIYMQLVKIYERSEKYDLAEQLYQTMIKRFRESSKVWCQCGLFYLKRNKLSECRKILQRALQSLAKRKHIKTICKFAQMEFRYGEPERGRTIFEGIMNNYPKRVDLWSIYLDMEIRQGDQNTIR
ncbi:hypothetical protein PIROE2DRAFT_40141, partial [Piromyces sp. E2]